MKTVKFALPALAMLFAIVASFASSKVVTSPEYYTKDLGNGTVECTLTITANSCTQASVTDPICKFQFLNFDGTTTQSAVYNDILVDGATFTACVNPLRHSINGGVINP